MTYQDYLEKIYYNPQHPGSFGGVDKLYKAVRQEGKYVLVKAKIRKWLETQETFGLHRQINRKFRRRKVIAPFIDYRRDEIVCPRQRRVRLLCSGHRRLFPLRTHVSLTLHSRQGNVVRAADFIPSRSKTHQAENRQGRRIPEQRGATTIEGRESGPLLDTERTEEFLRRKMHQDAEVQTLRYLSRHQTHRWIDVLDKITQSYNGRYHCSIKMPPRAVTKKDEARLWKLQYNTRQYAKAPT
jgi:hypothetical protein